MTERISKYDQKEGKHQRNHHTRFGDPTEVAAPREASADYTKKDLKRLGLAVEGDFSDVFSVSMFTDGESREIPVTPYLVRTPKGDERTYFYPNEVLKSR